MYPVEPLLGFFFLSVKVLGMNELFKMTDIFSPKFTLEGFVTYNQSVKVISEESVTDFLSGIKDLVNQAKRRIVDTNQDRVINEFMDHRFSTLSKAKKIKFTDFAAEVVSKPENFTGKYVDYLKTLVTVANDLIPDTDKTLSNLKMAVASFINESKSDGVMVVYGHNYIKKSLELNTRVVNEVSKYFKTNNGTVKDRVSSVLKTMGDMEYLYSETPKLTSVISHSDLLAIAKKSNEVSEMVDMLIEQNSKSGVLLNNESARKDLVDMLYTAAKQVETVSYLYGNVVYFYKALGDLSLRIREIG